MASPVFVQKNATQADTPSSPYAAPLPAGLTTGNFLIYTYNVFKTAGTGVPTTPTGWNLLTSFTTFGGSGLLYVFWRRIDGTEGSSVSTTFSGTIYVEVEFFEFSGVVASPTSPLDGTPVITTENTGSGTSHATGAYTTSQADTTLIDIIFANGGDATFTAGRGTKRSDTYQAGSGMEQAVATKTLAVAGTEASANWTFGSCTNIRAVSFALASGGGGGGSTFVPRTIIIS